jgi:6-phosphogluconolactonase
MSRSGVGSGSGRAVRWHVMPDKDALVSSVSTVIMHAAGRSIAAHGEFRLVLAGGNTPQAVYRRLVDANADWAHWQIYFGDERCLPVDDPERNSVMAMHHWLASVAIPPANIHAIPAERGADAAARHYATVVDAARPFDLVLLGMGEDGHTASLFPGQTHDEAELVHAVHDAPKPPADRVSLGESALSDAHIVLVLVTGLAKHPAVERWKRGEAIPVARIHGRNGVDVYLDQPASGGLPAGVS